MELKSIKSGSKLIIEESSKLSDKVIDRLLKDKVLGRRSYKQRRGCYLITLILTTSKYSSSKWSKSLSAVINLD